jgi:hypothetical protein
MQEEHAHPLVEPRLGAALGLAGVAGLGIGLMLAHVLIVWGLTISLLASVGVLWIYASHFGNAYTALTKGNKYRGASIEELIAAIVIVGVVLPTSIAVFFLAPDDVSANRARYQFNGISPIKYPDSPLTRFNFDLKNVGNLAVQKAVADNTGKIVDHPLTTQEEAQIMETLRSKVRAIPYAQLGDAEMAPGMSGVVTLSDVAASDADLADIQATKKALYIFVYAEFEDEVIRGKGYWQMQFCGWYNFTWTYWHNCNTPGRVIYVPKERR